MAGRNRQWLMPVLTRMDRMSSTHMAVESEPVPAVVGTAISGFSGPGGAFAAPTGLFVVHQLAGVTGEQVHGFGSVDARAPADGDERIPRPLLAA